MSHDIVKDMIHSDDLVKMGLFDARLPHYTSYPTVGHFSSAIGPEKAAHWLQEMPRESALQLYIHVPFCRRLCYFCACRTRATLHNRLLERFVDTLDQEVELIARHLPSRLQVSQIQMGGGSPSILPPPLMERVFATLDRHFTLRSDTSVEIEINPNDIDAARLDCLASLGLSRALISIPEFDPTVQHIIGRQQGFSSTARLVHMLRDRNIEQVHLNMLIGLPGQANEGLSETLNKALSLDPDSISVEQYIHAPWRARRQSLIPISQLPNGVARLRLRETAKTLLSCDGYTQIGIDHFALPSAPLAKAMQNGALTRSFFGYSDQPNTTIIGLGPSAIWRLPQGYLQNHTATTHHQQRIRHKKLSIVRGHELTDEDRLRWRVIESILCTLSVNQAALAHEFAQHTNLLNTWCQRIVERFPNSVALHQGELRILPHAEAAAPVIASLLDAKRIAARSGLKYPN